MHVGARTDSGLVLDALGRLHGAAGQEGAGIQLLQPRAAALKPLLQAIPLKLSSVL